MSGRYCIHRIASDRRSAYLTYYLAQNRYIYVEAGFIFSLVIDKRQEKSSTIIIVVVQFSVNELEKKTYITINQPTNQPTKKIMMDALGICSYGKVR